MSNNEQTSHPPQENVDSDTPDYFSYNSLDRDQFKSYDARSKRRRKFFFDRENLTAGEPWIDALENALNRMHAVAVFLRSMALARRKNAKCLWRWIGKPGNKGMVRSSR
jgi:hypothetical protein